MANAFCTLDGNVPCFDDHLFASIVFATFLRYRSKDLADSGTKWYIEINLIF